MSSPKVLFGFHAVGVRLKTAPASIIEIYFEPTRRDARMRQFLERAKEAEIDAIITEFTSKRDKYECMRVIGAAVPAGAVRDTLELMNDPNFEERGIIQTIDHPTNGKFRMATWPVRFNGKPVPVKPAPLLGANSDEVLKDWLGIGAEEAAKLRADKITSA